MKHCLPDCQQPTKLYVFYTYLLSDTIRGATMFMYGSIHSNDTFEKKNAGYHYSSGFRFFIFQKRNISLYFFYNFQKDSLSSQRQ